MIPQATGKLAREDWMAATVMKEKWFPGKLPNQEKWEVVRRGKSQQEQRNSRWGPSVSFTCCG